MGSRGRESTAVRHESSAIRIVGGVSRTFGSVCDIVTPLIWTHKFGRYDNAVRGELHYWPNWRRYISASFEDALKVPLSPYFHGY